jgi:4-alpha-glucanotransferase
MSRFGRLCGILMPVFSLRAKDDFGVGDFGAMDGFFAWMQRGKQQMWMTLPLLPLAPGDSSPYSCRSAFGLNPLFLHLAWLDEAVKLEPEEERTLERLRQSPRVEYPEVMGLKYSVLARAFALFDAGAKKGAAKGKEFEAWCDAQAHWLEDFVLFSALSEQHQQKPWWDWTPEISIREPSAMAAAKKNLGERLRWFRWLQFESHRQWERVRAQAKDRGVLLCGDEPFIIAKDSADCWAHPELLRVDARLGAPPDDFSADGQDWGLPWFDFDALKKTDDAWLRARAKAAAAYYDLRRVDHAIGYFRQWIRDQVAPKGRFIPATEPEAEALGEKNFRLLSHGAGIVAEDLGVIPKWARAVLEKLELPGYQVMRWAREDGVYRNPHQYPALSLVTTGTHDTETMRAWWETAPHWEREAAVRTFPELSGFDPGPNFSPQVHEALVAAMMNANSDYAIIPWQDVFGTTERVNLPGTVGPHNWTWRMAEPVEDLLTRDDTRSAAEWLAGLTVTGRRAT